MDLIRLLTVVSVLLLVGGGTVSTVTADGISGLARGTRSDSWTIVVVMAADNSLSGAVDGDLSEIVGAGTSSDVTVCILMDGSVLGDTRISVVGSSVYSVSVASVGISAEANMGDPSVLSAFGAWAYSTYPSTRTGFIFWDHGGGWVDLCHDGSHFDHVSMVELSSVLDAVTDHVPGSRLDLVGFDCCYMGTSEVATEVRPYSRYMVGSEEYEEWDGWHYEPWISSLRASPGSDGSVVGSSIVSAFDAYYSGSGTYTLSCTDLDAWTDAAVRVSDVAEDLRRVAFTRRTEIQAARTGTLAYIDTSGYSFLDLGDLLGHFYTHIPDPWIRATITGALSAYNASIVAEAHGPGLGSSTGLTIYFPASGEDYRPEYGTDTLWSVETAWEEFLAAYYRAYDVALTIPDPPTMEEDGAGIMYINATLGRATRAGIWVSVDNGEWVVDPEISLETGSHLVRARIWDGAAWSSMNTTTTDPNTGTILSTEIPYLIRTYDSGYSLVSVPVQGMSYTASTFADLLGASQVAYMTVLGTIREWHTGGSSLVDFTIRADVGYWVRVDQRSRTVQWSGDPWTQRTITVSRGWAIIPVGRSLSSSEFWADNPSLDYLAYWDEIWRPVFRGGESLSLERGTAIAIHAPNPMGVVI